MEGEAPQHAKRRFRTLASPTGRSLGATTAIVAFVVCSAALLALSGSNLSSPYIAASTSALHAIISAAVDTTQGLATSLRGGALSALPCRQSGYCSVGKLHAYVGEVDSLEGFQAAVSGRKLVCGDTHARCDAALHHAVERKLLQEGVHHADNWSHWTPAGHELWYLQSFCLTCSVCLAAIARMDCCLGIKRCAVAVAVVGAWKLGLANVMLHARDNASCAVLADAGFTNVSCVWSSRQDQAGTCSDMQ